MCYFGTPSAALLQFKGPRRPLPSPLLAHVYGLKNVYTALIRGYAAYHISNPELYDLATYTFMGVLFLYSTELLVFRTARFKEVTIPFATAGLGIYWMVTARPYYVV